MTNVQTNPSRIELATYLIHFDRSVGLKWLSCVVTLICRRGLRLT